jgi:hypothetical protein
MDNASAILITWNPFYKTGCSLYTLHHPSQFPLALSERLTPRVRGEEEFIFSTTLSTPNPANCASKETANSTQIRVNP